MAPGYYVARANSYLVITGQGITDVKLAKKALVLPFQKVQSISISPFDFSITLQAMTIEKLQFSLPAVFTIGPQDDIEALRKYSMLLTGEADGQPPAANTVTPTGRGHVQDIVKGIIEGETRVIVSSMTMEEIFRERQVFKNKVIHSVQDELNQFGLKIYNANVKELQDTPGSEYFKFLSRKAHEGASNQARIDVATARMQGEIGEAEKKGKTRQEISKIDAQTAVLETQRKSEKAQADAELTTTQTKLDMNIKLAQIEAQRSAESKDAELQRGVESKRAEMELERRRATDLVKAKIERESAQQAADAKLYKDQRSAEGSAFQARQDAEAKYFASVKAADAALVAKQREAQGIAEMAKAYGELANVLGGPAGLLQYLMLQDNTFEKLAHANAKAVQGLQPKINVWTQGDQGNGNGNDPMAPIRNLYQTLPPLLDTVQQQTGMTPPKWLMNMPPQEENRTNRVNGNGGDYKEAKQRAGAKLG
jgi:flotillin